MSSAQASQVKLGGHAAEARYAALIGGKKIQGSRKKDIRDSKEGCHSVKSGQKKWQIFLYARSRLKEDFYGKVKDSLLACIDAFPASYSEYREPNQRKTAKMRLQSAMVSLKQNLDENERKKDFLNKSFFNGGEVDYLAIESNGEFHVFARKDALAILEKRTYLANSKARQAGQFDDQKVVFKLTRTDKTIGEIEMRSDSEQHFREVKFWMSKPLVFGLLKSGVANPKQVTKGLVGYGSAYGYLANLLRGNR